MYAMYADGEMFFSTGALDDQAYLLLDPKLSLDVENNGSLSFVLPPGNRMHGRIQKMKTIVTVLEDGEEIFRGRALDVERDFYTQESVYCEGDKSFLLDTLYAPYSYTGSVQGFFRALVENHNLLADENRRFTVGNITAVGSGETMTAEDDAYTDTSSVIEGKLLSVYGGYLKTRTAGGTHYIDWVKEYSGTNSQPIAFAVNLLDLHDKAGDGDVFTVLIPLGASNINDEGEYDPPLTVESVNGGRNYIQDDVAVKRYGKIWRTRTWSYEDDPARLLAKGREYLKTGAALETLTLKAIDMHFVDPNAQPIRLGDKVRILSNPHGIDKTDICARMEMKLLSPESTEYTFGVRPRTLTENAVRTEDELGTLTGGGRGGGGGKGVKKELEDILRWAKINVDETNAYIQLTAGELNKTNGRLSAAEIELDGVNARVDIAASRLDEVEGRTTSAEIALDGANARIDLQASEIRSLENGITSAEIAIDGLEAEIALKVNKNGVISAINISSEEILIQSQKINLSGYVTASALQTEIANITNSYSERILTETLTATSCFSTNLYTSSLRLGDRTCTWKSRTVQQSIPDFSKADVTLPNGNVIRVVTGWKEAPSNKRTTLYYLGYD